MTDNDKAPASEVSSSDRAREEFEDYMVMIHHCTEDNLSVDPENDDRYFDCNIDLVWSAWQHQQSTIDSQRLALEEKGREISRLESVVRTIQGVGKVADRLTKENEQLQREVGMFKAGLQAADDKLIEVQGENTRLQSRVKELEAHIQHMDNACLDNFGVTITSILD